MQQQIIVSGVGGQGVILMTRFLAEAAMEEGCDILASETHGMAMWGGTVISHVKVGAFRSPLVRRGQADIGLFLQAPNLDIHGGLMKKGGLIFVNTAAAGDHLGVDATGLAKTAGSAVMANLVLLGFAVASCQLFCGIEAAERVVARISPPDKADMNMKAFRIGLAAK